MKKEKNTYAIINEMFDTISVVRNFSTKNLSTIVWFIRDTKKILLTWEWSSRIFPAKNVIYNTLRQTSELSFLTEWSIQALELNLDNYTIIWASNSWKTKEVIKLFRSVKSSRKVALTAYENTLLWSLSDDEHVLHCGPEKAVAATKSVVEQWLFYQYLISEYFWNKIEKDQLIELSNKLEEVLNIDIDSEIIEHISEASTIYFAWRNNWVAEELTLKTNEITRKKSDYLEGTYLVHGVEEVMSENDIVILINPYKSEEQKIKEVLENGVGLNVYAVSSENTLFPTIKVPKMSWFNWYIELMTWLNILVSVWLKLWINLDKTERARKIWNENND